MPELPEVESTRLSFAATLTDARITSVHLGKPLRWPLNCEPEFLQGQRIHDITRRSKYILMRLDQGYLLWHLGMSGSLKLWPAKAALPAPGAHDHVDFLTTQGHLRLNDPRRFGALVWVEALSQGLGLKMLGHLGLEPLESGFSGEALHQGFKGKTQAIKAVLLGGQVVVGVGNIYASEALFKAGIDPRLAAGRLSRPRCDRLARAIREILLAALASGGSTLRNYSNAVGQAGDFQNRVQVYDREGEPCKICSAPIRRLLQGQRSTFYCAACQKK